MKPIILFIICVVIAGSATANTIRVERDGSGDYMVIQDAVNAASAGDTILIGPGRYAEREIVTTPGWSVPVYILVQQDNLSIIGAGNGQTIVGQEEPWDVSQPWTRGIEASSYWGNSAIYVEGIQFENITFAVGGNPGPNCEVVSCQFIENHYSVSSIGPISVTVSQCVFTGMPLDGQMILSHGNSDLLIEDCEFFLDPNHQLNQRAVNIQGTANVTIESSQFLNGGHGLYIVSAGGVTVNACSFEGQRVKGIYCNSVPGLLINSCQFSDVGYAITITGTSSIVEMQNSVISNVANGSFGFRNLSELIVNNCILARGPEFVIDQYVDCVKTPETLIYIDMRNNDWGTTDAAEIESWIHVCDYEVDYMPFIGMPVATESISFDGLKAIFRGETD